MELHIWGIPNVTVVLEKNYKKDLSNKIIVIFDNFNKLSKIININNAGIHQAFRRNLYPVYLLEKILVATNCSKKICEKKIKAYKTSQGKKWIFNPKLPIRVTQELYELTGHLLGDGYLTTSSGLSNYTNTCRKLTDYFKSLVSKVFGDINLTENLDKRSGAISVTLPQCISRSILTIFPELSNKKVPNGLWSSSRKTIFSFVRAFADDEATVTTSEIRLTSKNKELLEKIRELLVEKLPKFSSFLTRVKESGNVYIFSIKGDGLFRYQKLIGFIHPEKEKSLAIEIERKLRNNVPRSEGVMKSSITRLLDRPRTSKELTHILGIQIQNVRKHLRHLKILGFVKICGYGKYNVPVWIKVKDFKSLVDNYKKRILEILSSNPDTSTKELSTIIKLSKDETLRYLHLLEKENEIKHTVSGRTFFWSLK